MAQPARELAFKPDDQDPRSRRREPHLESYPLTSMQAPYAPPHQYKQINNM